MSEKGRVQEFLSTTKEKTTKNLTFWGVWGWKSQPKEISLSSDYKIPIQQVGKSFISLPCKHNIHMQLSCNTVKFWFTDFPQGSIFGLNLYCHDCILHPIVELVSYFLSLHKSMLRLSDVLLMTVYSDLMHAPMKIFKQSFRNITKKQMYFPLKAPSIYPYSPKKCLPKNSF